jgi:hypothetical protein
MSSPPTVESTKQEIAAYYRVNYRDFLSYRKRLKDSGDITRAWDRLYDAFRSHCTNLKKKGEKWKLEYKDEWPNYVSKNFLQSSDGEGKDGEVHPPASKRSPRHALLHHHPPRHRRCLFLHHHSSVILSAKTKMGSHLTHESSPTAFHRQLEDSRRHHRQRQRQRHHRHRHS